MSRGLIEQHAGSNGGVETLNLAGAGDILSHELTLAADYYTPTDATLIPTGDIRPVQGTPMDFRIAHPIGSRIAQLEGDEPGYDSNYVINRGGSGAALAARVHEPRSGRIMEVHTTQPGVQLYTANYLDGALAGKRGMVYQRHSGFCLETQHFPDSVNHPKFPSVILRPGHTYRHTTLHKFSAQ